jgi:biotin carboxyl carrier protein
MPGTVLDVLVSEGQAVKQGDVLVILEAMKMENEIMAAEDGTVGKIYTSKGAAVNTGDALLDVE